MTREALIERVREAIVEPVPQPGQGTAERHARLFAVGREDLSLARLVEAHWDAVAILAEAGREAEPGAIYGVWAAEAPGKTVRMERGSLNGRKPFCSGAVIVDRALVTVKEPEALLVDVDLKAVEGAVIFDTSAWKTNAFTETKTSEAEFRSTPVSEADIVGQAGYYLGRPGFWHGACGPTACWAGGAAGLADWALRQERSDPHTLAHLGAMTAEIWAMQACLQSAGQEIDADWPDVQAAQRRALTVRHVVEHGCSEVLRRLGRAYGPHPLAMNEDTARRYVELELYIRQSHAERDLEALGRIVSGR